jgi:PilZ domain
MAFGNGAERRKFGRKETSIDAQAFLPGRGGVNCVIKNISQMGALLEFATAFQPRGNFRLKVDGNRLDVTCAIRRQDGLSCGVEFVAINVHTLVPAFVDTGARAVPFECAPKPELVASSGREMRARLFGKAAPAPVRVAVAPPPTAVALAPIAVAIEIAPALQPSDAVAALVIEPVTVEVSLTDAAAEIIPAEVLGDAIVETSTVVPVMEGVTITDEPAVVVEAVTAAFVPVAATVAEMPAPADVPVDTVATDLTVAPEEASIVECSMIDVAEATANDLAVAVALEVPVPASEALELEPMTAVTAAIEVPMSRGAATATEACEPTTPVAQADQEPQSLPVELVEAAPPAPEAALDLPGAFETAKSVDAVDATAALEPVPFAAEPELLPTALDVSPPADAAAPASTASTDLAVSKLPPSPQPPEGRRSVRRARHAAEVGRTCMRRRVDGGRRGSV